MKAYPILVADPPWQFDDRLPGKKRGASKHYSTMSIEDIGAFQMPVTLAEDAILFLWRVASMPREAILVCEAWGFEPKSEIVWVKAKRPTDSDPLGTQMKLSLGMGHYVRGAHETAIIATRGRPKVMDRSVRSVFFAPRGEHSAKPDEFYDLVEALHDGPYCELFARKRRQGWTQFGDELA